MEIRIMVKFGFKLDYRVFALYFCLILVQVYA